MSQEPPLTQADLEAVLRSVVDRLNARSGADALAAHLQQPVRRQHFYFVHQHLAERLETGDHALEDLLCAEDATRRLRELWVEVGAAVNAEGEPLIPAESLECFPFSPNDQHRGVIIQFPPPERTCEAYLAAVIFSSDPRVRDLAVYYHYFLLELGWDLDGAKRTVLCEWRCSRHYNYREGCEPRREAFEDLLRRKFFAPGMFDFKLD